MRPAITFHENQYHAKIDCGFDPGTANILSLPYLQPRRNLHVDSSPSPFLRPRPNPCNTIDNPRVEKQVLRGALNAQGASCHNRHMKK